ncbi:type II 3-dehydroquinate dehydratase [Fusobacterium necrophorum]|uniref:3-dehydroquinate dehydratase n=1 Tax=Fusobacterium necrophorum TaxID=859 RepID=A0A4Q2KVM5_9FUSO|nr:type II 3-dehydroquinate dehydratase [Fusobacterium necrophorum]RXZ68917.1 type II 3-dehydroquinate dehydratase [Fusobacterium necrophorum]
MKIMVIHGPNLNFLGIREKNIYGTEDYESLCHYITTSFPQDEITCLQSNSEGQLIDFIQKAHLENYDGIVINAGAYTHTSIALYDALRSVSTVTVEVHISNIYAREAFRHHSYLAPACLGQISGFGKEGYIYAIQKIKIYLGGV